MDNEENIDYFIRDGVYRMNGFDEYLFLCVSTTSIQIGKLVQYRTDTPRKPGSIYEKTGVTYFLDCFYEDDVKSIFVKRENYELVGKVGFDYELSSNSQYLYRKQKCT